MMAPEYSWQPSAQPPRKRVCWSCVPRLENMRAMRANRKQELKEDLVGLDPLGVIDTAILPAHLTELTRPECQQRRRSLIFQTGVDRALAPVVSRPGEPAPGELIVTGHVHPERGVDAGLLLAAAPEQLGPAEEPTVERPLQRPIANRRVHGEDLGLELGTDVVAPSGV